MPTKGIYRRGSSWFLSHLFVPECPHGLFSFKVPWDEQKKLFFLCTYTRVKFLNLRHWFSEHQYDQLSFKLAETWLESKNWPKLKWQERQVGWLLFGWAISHHRCNLKSIGIVLFLINMQFISQLLCLIRTCGLEPFKVFQDLEFITAVKDFHNRLPSVGFLYWLYAYYFEIDSPCCHFLTNYKTTFQLISNFQLISCFGWERSFLIVSVFFSWRTHLLSMTHIYIKWYKNDELSFFKGYVTNRLWV